MAKKTKLQKDESIKKRLKYDLYQEVETPVTMPSCVNEMLSELCASGDITTEEAKSIELILTSDLKANDDSVFQKIGNIKAKIESDLKRIKQDMVRKRCERQELKLLHGRMESAQYNFSYTPFDPVKYVRDLVKEANNKSFEKATKEKMELIKKKVPRNEWPCQPRNQQYNHIGSLLLTLHPVDMKMPEKETNYKVYQFKSEPIITTTLYTPPKSINVCNELGLSGKRLYFSPMQFPITNVETAGDSETFDQLKDYIVKQSSLDGNTPVVFHGTQPGCKRFVCKYTLRKEWEKKFEGIPFLRCKFSFSVRWDKYGYYIHISKPNPTYSTSVGCCMYDEEQQMVHRKYVVGCEFHSHM